MALRYDFFTLANQMGGILEGRERELREERAAYGMDMGDELGMQGILAEGLKTFYEVSREVHYPSSVGKKRSFRQRCDLVLTPMGRVLGADWEPAGLFGGRDAGAGEGLWLEVKVAAQYREGGVRHGGYGSQWRDAVVEDLRKMEGEVAIKEAGLVLIVFNESTEILEKDLDMFEVILARKEVLAGFRQVRTLEIGDRIGHRLCSAAIWPTIQREG